MKTLRNVFLVFLGIIFILFASMVIYYVYFDFVNEKKLVNELNYISNNFDKEIVDERLNKYVTNGDYKVIEKVVKDYWKYLVSVKNDYDNLFDDELIDIIYFSTFDSDAKKFENTINKLMLVNSSLDNLSESLNNLDLYDKINQYKLDDYFITHYKELIFDVEAKCNKIINDINIDKEIIETYYAYYIFLRNNSDFWYLENGYIYFDNEDLGKQYDLLLNNIYSFGLYDDNGENKI